MNNVTERLRNFKKSKYVFLSLKKNGNAYKNYYSN